MSDETGKAAADDGFRKCRFQLEDCNNWTNEGLTRGTSEGWNGPPDASGRSTLVQRPRPICGPCLAELGEL